MSEHRYPPPVLIGDGLRGGIGLILTAGPLIALDVHWIVGWVLGAGVVLFGAFLARTALRGLTVVRVGDQGIGTDGPLGRTIAWPSLTGMRLNYYAVKRNRPDGWMYLVLKGDRGTMKLESTLSGFEDIVDRAFQAARRNGVAMSETTVTNLVALGIATPDLGSAPAPTDGKAVGG